eukprot:TRINITY_DN20765_c0_g1_i1.p1 TRINITY_DN20765_c0_g1~~TRINITY_DN20765_c0_g1_i1.p1  ORF type:complete len:214 (+),score=53.49 TRINITY_DN20765_c0_g1_i1:29-670(+)
MSEGPEVKGIAEARAIDAEQLLTNFLKKPDCSFLSFLQVWREMNMKYIHDCIEIIGQQKHIDSVAEAFCSKLFEKGPLAKRFGVIYAIYLLYHTQPEPKCRITTSTSVAIELLYTIEKATENGEKDVCDAFQNMLSIDAIKLAIVPAKRGKTKEEETVPPLPRSIDKNSLLELASSLEKVHSEYLESKSSFENFSPLEIVRTNQISGQLRELI